MNDRTPQYPPIIKPLPLGETGYLWSVMIPTYNCSKYLKRTIESVLKQDIGAASMQIEVIDDFSTDADVEQIIKEAGKGRVNFYRQKENVGSLRNFETCINRSKGKFIHILHGDDQVVDGFYKEIAGLFTNHPDAGAAFTGFSVIDEHDNFLYNNDTVTPEAGIIENWFTTIAEKQRLRTCAIVVRRSVYEQIGSFFAVHYGEDWEMFVRIAANYPVAYSLKNLARYRIHGGNISAAYMNSGQDIADIKKVISIIYNYLPAEKRKEITRKSRKNFAHHFSGNAHAIYQNQRNARAALKQMYGALSLDVNSKTVLALAKLYLKRMINYR
ncbi:MAG: glycosyltransferase [Ferruginibacter sp.]